MSSRMSCVITTTRLSRTDGFARDECDSNMCRRRSARFERKSWGRLPSVDSVAGYSSDSTDAASAPSSDGECSSNSGSSSHAGTRSSSIRRRQLRRQHGCKHCQRISPSTSPNSEDAWVRDCCLRCWRRPAALETVQPLEEMVPLVRGGIEQPRRSNRYGPKASGMLAGRCCSVERSETECSICDIADLPMDNIGSPKTSFAVQLPGRFLYNSSTTSGVAQTHVVLGNIVAL
eukprot:TRINITY_DN121751_c0_g1_i1.p1 TRINITY_DN121751_c0_g1~~TRINITY_DN121751_c0_g1_i1.p1  ORF type:complete len:232 (-),score=31.26 TRINITY_DN121751_c0_g1_i1:141-836(-)